MVVGDDGSTLALVRQVDHQVQCRDMARAWGNDGFRRLAHWDAVERAAARHDDGWRAEDAAPVVGADGRPVDFPETPRVRHTAFYEAAIAAVCEEDPRAGLVCCLHGRGLYEKRLGVDGPIPVRAGRPAVERGFIARQLRRQRALERALGDDAATWARDAFLLLQAWDALSLYLVWTGLRRRAEWRLPCVPRGPSPAAPLAELRVGPAGAATAGLDPWPFAAGQVDVPVDVITIPSGPYADDEALRAAVRVAPVARVDYRLVPGRRRGAGRTPPRHA